VNLTKNDWATLSRLRDSYLGAEFKGTKDYWSSLNDLALYDSTFGQRIAWKWQNVILESKEKLQSFLTKEDWRVVDWGCGTAIASRTLLLEIPAAQIKELVLIDRSSLAKEWATKKIKELAPELPVQNSLKMPSSLPTLVLISHVLDELDNEALTSLLSTINESYLFIWVEPGTKIISQKLVSLREKLRSQFSFLAPCPHSLTCGLTHENNRSHWCHHFAKSPDEVFHSSFWSEFSKQMGIDIRSLPVSYLVGSKAPTSENTKNRILGRARIYKGYAMALCCERSGVSDRKITSKENSQLVKKLKSPEFSQWVDSKVTT
jgi:ribosomal protein RSM22 (predicted rRNA methylase)